MLGILVSLLPVIIGAAVLPVLVIMILLILASEGGTAKAAFFVLGIFAMRALQGLVFGFVFRPDPTAEGSSEPSWILSTLLLVLGTLMLVSALKTILTDADPDAAPPKWMAMLDRLTPSTALLMGLGMTVISVKIWLFSMAAVGTIREAGLATSQAIIAFLLYDLLSVSLIAMPVLLSAIVPAWASRNLNALSDWMARHNRAITIVVSLLFGVVFFYKGLTGLLG